MQVLAEQRSPILKNDCMPYTMIEATLLVDGQDHIRALAPPQGIMTRKERKEWYRWSGRILAALFPTSLGQPIMFQDQGYPMPPLCCPQCLGLGKVAQADGPETVLCPRCNGRGDWDGATE
jgi:hypothetical protein